MSAYYNEHDPKAAAWLRELIASGLIAPGYVDERSITDISPHELTGYTQQHFFAGIGGWSYALRLAGWPDDKPVRTGSCPCQPFSQAGKQLGTADERHLWPVFRDLITFGEPTVTFGEQVASKAGRDWLAGVRADLEGLGYAVGAADLCAAGVGAPHIRQRLYWVADAEGQRFDRGAGVRGTNRRAELKANGAARRLADSNGGNASTERQQRSGQQRLKPEDNGACGLEHAESDGRQQRRTEPGRRGIASGCGSVGLGDAMREGREGKSLGLVGAVHQDYWSAFDRLPCTDGKTRRIEPGSFPLANGVSGRVGLLRGYGNAIVPQVAAHFVSACMEAIS